MAAYESLLHTVAPKVSFGYTTIHIYRPHELESGQLGYSVSPAGESLIGDEDGKWKKSWLVIGYDEVCGDPIFIDRSEEGYPVYTAMHGEGRWSPQRIAVSLTSFALVLSALAIVAQGREHPVALERNPLAPSDREGLLAVIQQQNPKMDLQFWEVLLSQ